MQASIKAKKIVTFNAAHFLAGYQGKCANMHGHTYTLEIVVSRMNGALIVGGTSDGMVVDFSELKTMINEVVIDKVDHKVLNEVFDFRTTSENLASYFFRTLTVKCEEIGLRLEKVILWESQHSCIEISE